MQNTAHALFELKICRRSNKPIEDGETQLHLGQVGLIAVDLKKGVNFSDA